MASVAVALLLTLAALMAALVAADRRRQRHVPFPWLWTIPSVAVIGLTFLVGAAFYPALPAEIPVHFGFDGVADRFVPTTPFTAFSPLLTQVLVSAVLAASAALLARTPYPAGAAGPDSEDTLRRATATAVTTRALLVLATGANLALLLLAEPVWRGYTTLSTSTLASAAVCVLVGAGAVVVAAVRSDHASPRRFGLACPSGWGLVLALIASSLVTAFVGHLA